MKMLVTSVVAVTSILSFAGFARAAQPTAAAPKPLVAYPAPLITEMM